MRRTKEDADLTHQSLLNAALEVFSQKGYDASRLEDVAEAAGVTLRGHLPPLWRESRAVLRADG